MAITKTVFDVVNDEIKPYIDLNAGNIAAVETTSTAAAEHLAGTQIVFKGKLYNVTQDIAQGDTITVGTNIVAADPVSSDIATLSNYTIDKTGVKNRATCDLKEIKAQNTIGTWNGNAYTDNGITITVDSNGIYSVSGTLASANTNLRTSISLLKAGSYKLSGCPSGGGYPKYQIIAKNASTNADVAVDTGNGAEFTLASDTYVFMRLYIYSEHGAYSNFAYKPMITDADVQNSDYAHFVPYAETNQALTKDTKGLTENAFENGAVNLFKTTATSSTNNNIAYVVNNNGTVSLTRTQEGSATAWISLGDVVLPAGRYKASGCPSGGTAEYSDNGYLLNISSADSLGNFTFLDSGNGAYFELSQSRTIRLRIRVGKLALMSGLVFKPMITVADMPNSDYAHYVPFAKSNKELTKLWNANKYVEQAINWESNVDTYYDRTNIVAHFRVNEFTRHCILDVTDLVTKFTMNAGEVFVLFNVGGSFIPFVNERKDVPILKKDSTYYNGFVTKASSHNGVSFTAKESIPSGTSITFTLDWFY